MKGVLAGILTLLVWGQGAWAATGETAALLDMGVGARALGMGGAFVGMAADPSALAYNPAALAYVTGQQVSAYAARPFGVLDHLSVGVAGAHMGLTLLHLGASGALATDEFGNPTPHALSFASHAAIAGFGYALAPGLSLGGQLKVYVEENGAASGVGWALEPALLYADGPWMAGAVLRNALSDPIAFDDGHRRFWSRSLVLGASWTWEDESGWMVKLAGDVDGLLQGDLGFHAGGELWLKTLGLRIGWDRGAFTAGASVLHGDLALHIAYGFHPVLPPTVRLSASTAL
ncbi:MAG TPA: hypothetical protein VIL47_00210 [Candidatus Bipolaricaulota bacterium]